MDMGIATQSREQFSFTVDMRENVMITNEDLIAYIGGAYARECIRREPLLPSFFNARLQDWAGYSDRNLSIPDRLY